MRAHLSLFCMLCVAPASCNNNRIVYNGERVEIQFSENLEDLPNLDVLKQNEIRFFINGTKVPLFTSGHHAFGFTEIEVNESLSVLLNERVDFVETGLEFILQATFLSRGLQTIHFYALNVESTSREVLLIEDVDGFGLWCNVLPPTHAYVEWVYRTHLPNQRIEDVAWNKLGQIQTADLELTIHQSGNNHSLRVWRRESNNNEVLEGFAGQYACRLTLHSAVVYYKTIIVASPPRMQYNEILPQYTNDKTATLGCRVLGYPPPNATWYRIDAWYTEKDVENDMTPRADLSKLMGVTVEDEFELPDLIRTSYITLPRLKRGYYVCKGVNTYGRSQDFRFIHARSSLAFVYPLVGIMLEFAILASVLRFCPSSKERTTTNKVRRIRK